MRLVLGKLNRVRLPNLMREAVPYCTEVEAAVAYASDLELVEHCVKAGLSLTYYGLLDEDGEGVALPVLRRLHALSLRNVHCRLVCGYYHPKVIWWRGYGAYIGSANLTKRAWWQNVECGVFCTEDELAEQGLAEDLEVLFSHLEEVSTPLKDELLEALQALDQSASTRARQRRIEQLQHVLGALPKNQPLDRVPAKGVRPNRRKLKFIKEWNATLQTLRDLGNRLSQDGRRPVWLPKDRHVPVAVHCDQLLHAYYYAVVLRTDDEGRSVEKVENQFQENSAAPLAAFERAVEWWVQLKQPPYGEDTYILESAPSLTEAFSSANLPALTEERFCELALYVNSFRTHARQVQNSVYGLPPEHRESEEERTKRLARRVWTSRSVSGRTFPELLSFVLHGRAPATMEERIWVAVSQPEWMIEHFKLSSIGELVGWALPEQYPPRNNRTNKALRSLGFPVRLYHD